MDANIFSSLSRLSNDALLAEVKRLVTRERDATVSLIAHLAEIDARGLHVEEGCPSLFVYCTQILHLSEFAAFGRIKAARAARKFPVLLGMLARGEVNLTTVTLLRRVLTPENHLALLDEAKHKSRREVEAIVARLRPQPSVPTSVRKLPERRTSTAEAASPAAAAPTAAPVSTAAPTWAVASNPTTRPSGPETGRAAAPAEPAAAMPGSLAAACAAAGYPPPSPRPAVVEPLSPGRYRVQFTASAETHAKLRRAQDLLRHQIPDGDLAVVIDRALGALLREVERKRFGAVTKAGASRGRARGSRYIPPAVRRAVWKRDGEQCTFVGRGGLRCGERRFLEFDHAHPHADGGPAAVENLRLRCRAHNRYAAERSFGPPEAPTVRESPASWA